jgi:hypothetical protein
MKYKIIASVVIIIILIGVMILKGSSNLPQDGEENIDNQAEIQ